MIPRYLSIFIIGVAFVTFIAMASSNVRLFNQEKMLDQVKAASLKNDSLNPVKVENFQNPAEITARSAVVIDAKTGTVLFAKNADFKHLPASTTKLMTALVALENCNPQQVITIDEVEEEGTQMGLQAQDKVTVENLLYGLLINSGNDAASAISRDCSKNPSSFIDSMNEKAKELNMQNTHFTNPTGFDDSYQYSTAADLARLANVAIANPLISKIVSIKSTVVTDISGNKTYYLKNINELLGVVDGIEGVKTGETPGSLENLITKTTRSGNSIVISVLGSKDRFGESKKLIEWAFLNHQWI